MLRRLRRAGMPWFAQATELARRGQGPRRGAVVRLRRRGASHRRRRRAAAPRRRAEHADRAGCCASSTTGTTRNSPGSRGSTRCGETSLPGLRIAGDGAAIAGALAAEASGALAALGAARCAAASCRAPNATGGGAWRARGSRGSCASARSSMRCTARPSGWPIRPTTPSSAAARKSPPASVREMARLGCQGPNQTKFFSRCGMGPCQGRICGLAVTQILASALGKPPARSRRLPHSRTAEAGAAGLDRGAGRRQRRNTDIEETT